MAALHLFRKRGLAKTVMESAVVAGMNQSTDASGRGFWKDVCGNRAYHADGLSLFDCGNPSTRASPYSLQT